MSTTVMLTGMLPAIVLIATALAFPVCLVLLGAYRASVRKGMASVSGSGAATSEATAITRAPASHLQTLALDANSNWSRAGARTPALQRALSGPWRASAVYAIAGFAYALVMTSGWLAATGDTAIVWTKLLILIWTYYWPAVLTILLVAAYDKGRRVQILGLYFSVLAVLIAIAIARNPAMGVGDLPLYWLIMNGPATVLLMAFLYRRIRAVGPLILVFLIAIAVGSQSILSVAAADEALLRSIASIGFDIGLNAQGVFVGMILIGMVVFGLLGWPLLRLIGRRYERKKFSDQSIMLDSLWLLFAVVQSIGLAFESPPWILTGLAAFIAYKLVSGLGFGWVFADPLPGTSPKTLLLLRVFALGPRSEQLFDKLRIHWQYTGSISMIAGPDLVTSTVEPHEFLDFVRGHLARQFVASRPDLEQRIANADNDRDPDGRYRINEFFCHNDTWQMTMERLALASDAVLMDLRSFSPTNQGCIFELGRLVDGVDMNSVVFLVDDTTDRTFLESTLQRLWQNMSADSPNQAVASPTARLFRIERQSEGEVRAMLGRLLEPAPAAA